jgi:hypothetical protein
MVAAEMQYPAQKGMSGAECLDVLIDWLVL